MGIKKNSKLEFELKLNKQPDKKSEKKNSETFLRKMSESNTEEEIINTDDELLSDVPRSIEWKIRKNRSTKVFEKLKSTGRHKHISELRSAQINYEQFEQPMSRILREIKDTSHEKPSFLRCLRRKSFRLKCLMT